jgi:hypothetical protein
VDIGFSHDLGRDAEVGRALDRLANIAHLGCVQGEAGNIQDGFVAQVESLEPETFVEAQPVLAREHDDGPETSFVTVTDELDEAIEKLVTCPDRVPRAEGNAEEGSISEDGTSLGSEDVLLVFAGREGVEGVAVTERAADQMLNAGPISLWCERSRIGRVACQKPSDVGTSSCCRGSESADLGVVAF